MISPLYLGLTDGTDAALTDHAIDRWRELVCPLATLVDAVRLLDHVLRLEATVEPAPPPWITGDFEINGAAGIKCWVTLGDYTIPVGYQPSGALFCPTLIARGALSKTERHTRNYKARSDRSRRARAHRRTAAQSARSGDTRRRRDGLAPGIDPDVA